MLSIVDMGRAGPKMWRLDPPAVQHYFFKRANGRRSEIHEGSGLGHL